MAFHLSGKAKTLSVTPTPQVYLDVEEADGRKRSVTTIKLCFGRRVNLCFARMFLERAHNPTQAGDGQALTHMLLRTQREWLSIPQHQLYEVKGGLKLHCIGHVIR